MGIQTIPGRSDDDASLRETSADTLRCRAVALSSGKASTMEPEQSAGTFSLCRQIQVEPAAFVAIIARDFRIQVRDARQDLGFSRLCRHGKQKERDKNKCRNCWPREMRRFHDKRWSRRAIVTDGPIRCRLRSEDWETGERTSQKPRKEREEMGWRAGASRDYNNPVPDVYGRT